MSDQIKELMERQAQTGTIDWIGIRPIKKADLQPLNQVEASPDLAGLAGDHYHGNSGERQVTLIQAEHLMGVARMLGTTAVDPALTRRNLVVSGINLLSLKDKKFSIGDQVILQMTGLCHPCTRMEENLGHGGYNAMRGHGGITARVIRGGMIRVGDQVSLISDE